MKITTTEPAAEKPKASWDDTIKTILLAIVLATVFRSCAYEPFHIPSGSMKSNLLVGDYLFVSKPAYGYSRYSFPFGFPLFKGRILESLPERGDVVVFRLPANPRIDYIKRIVGLPGDKVQLIDGIVHINGQPLPRRRVDDYSDDEEPRHMRIVPRYIETNPEGRSYTVLKERRGSVMDDTQVYTVPPGHYFMMGDNRDHSRDSRYIDDIGFIPLENIVGKAQLIFFSINADVRFWEVWRWPGELRYDRFFKKIR